MSSAGADYLKGAHPEFAGRVKVARIGIDIPRQVSKSSSDGVIRILSASRVDRNKRVVHIGQVALEVARLLRERVEWTHLGGGPRLGELVRWCDRVNPREMNCRVLGHVPQAFVRHYLATEPVDLFVNFSLSEGIAVSVLEALAFGVPTLATRVGGMSEAVFEPFNQAIPASTTPEAAATLAASLVQFPSTSREARREMVAREFHEDVVYRSWANELVGIALER